MTGSIGVGAVDNGLESFDGRAQVTKPGMNDTRFPPQEQRLRRKQKHAVNYPQRILGPSGALVPCFDVVLQPDQNIPIADGLVMFGRQFGIQSGSYFQQLAQIRRRAFDSIIERVDNDPVAAAANTNHEMAGKVQPVGGIAMRAGRLKKKYAEGNRQSLLAVDHTHQISILNVVISERVAAVAVCLQNYGGERFWQVFSSSKCIADIVGQFFDVIPVSIRRDTRPVKCSKRQRALSQVDGGVIAPADISENVFCGAARHHDGLSVVLFIRT